MFDDELMQYAILKIADEDSKAKAILESYGRYVTQQARNFITKKAVRLFRQSLKRTTE